jgi:hypothetical protein
MALRKIMFPFGIVSLATTCILQAWHRLRLQPPQQHQGSVIGVGHTLDEGIEIASDF